MLSTLQQLLSFGFKTARTIKQSVFSAQARMYLPNRMYLLDGEKIDDIFGRPKGSARRALYNGKIVTLVKAT